MKKIFRIILTKLGLINFVLFFYKYKTNRELIKILHKEIIDLNKNEWFELLDYVFTDKELFNFLYIRFDKDLPKMFYKNFNQLKYIVLIKILIKHQT